MLLQICSKVFIYLRILDGKAITLVRMKENSGNQNNFSLKMPKFLYKQVIILVNSEFVFGILEDIKL